ncbi:hypothetical protein EI94DRAFT_1704261 [Lactarius quietus]|nr:hypothetical protein EI94DRAFT_1704261 [Lactarius quietus]
MPNPLQEGVSGDVSVDGIALAIRSLLRDIEAVQFPDEFHPPQHVAHSTVSFDVIGTIIHPALDNFIQIVRDRNHNIAANDGHMLPAAPNRQKLNPQASGVFPQTQRSGRNTRPTEWAKAMQVGKKNARSKEVGWKGK